MIRPLRRLHQVTFLFLALLLPPIFSISLALRNLPKSMDKLPGELVVQVPELGVVIYERKDLWDGLDIVTRLLADHNTPPTRLGIQLSSQIPLPKPDVLVYWSEKNIEPDKRGPQHAFILGSFTGSAHQTLALPELALQVDGYLTLYSLGHQEVVVSTPLPTATMGSKGS